MSYGGEAARYFFVEDFVWIFREYYFLIWSFVKFPVLQSFLCKLLHCLSIDNNLVMNLISDNSQISTSSRFRNFSGYVF